MQILVEVTTHPRKSVLGLLGRYVQCTDSSGVECGLLGDPKQANKEEPRVELDWKLRRPSPGQSRVAGKGFTIIRHGRTAASPLEACHREL